MIALPLHRPQPAPLAAPGVPVLVRRRGVIVTAGTDGGDEADGTEAGIVVIESDAAAETAAGNDDQGESTETASIEDIAAAWLEAERALAGERPSEQAEATARELSDRYDEAIRGATQEDLRLAWEAARKAQADEVMGSPEWADRRQVSELLRTEYLARDSTD
jgi:hypothetical protein